MLNRRTFLKSFSTTAAASMLPAGIASTILKDQWNTFNLDATISNDNSEVFWETIKAQFHFAEGVRYFNNASLGGASLPIRNATNTFRDLLDGFPSKYMWGGWDEEKEATRQAIANLFGADAEEIAMNHNTTEGMNIIARSFNFRKKDEVILANHEHSSGTIPWMAWQVPKGVKLVRPVLPILPTDPNEIVEIYRKAITKRTKIISICHGVNTNGMVLPIKAISEMAHQHGVLVAVDGAQTMGMFNINLNELGCDFYTASAHKWMFAPKGVGIFYAKKGSQHYLKPLMVARGYKDKSIRRLENYNTRNLPEVLGIGAAVEYHNLIGSDKIHNRSYDLKTYFRNAVEQNPKLKLKTPAHDALSCAIQVVEVVGKDVKDVKDQLFDKYGIDCRPMSSHDLNALRISLAIYITKADIDYLINALDQIS